jgi:hypothetical protein
MRSAARHALQQRDVQRRFAFDRIVPQHARPHLFAGRP